MIEMWTLIIIAFGSGEGGRAIDTRLQFIDRARCAEAAAALATIQTNWPIRAFCVQALKK